MGSHNSNGMGAEVRMYGPSHPSRGTPVVHNTQGQAVVQKSGLDPTRSLATNSGTVVRTEVIEPIIEHTKDLENWWKRLGETMKNLLIGGAVVAGIVVVGTVKNAVR